MDDNKGFLGLIKNIPALKKRDTEIIKNNDNQLKDNDTIRNMSVTGGASVIAGKHAEMASKKFAKESVYSSETVRPKIDYRTVINKNGESIKKNAKEIIKKETFGNEFSVKDPYSGNDLIMKKNDVKLLYGNENMAEHLAEGDHIKPLERVYNENSNNPWITTDDIANTANNNKNLVVTSRKINNAKRSRTNEEFVNDIEYLEKKGINLSDEQKQRMLNDGKNADIFIKKDLSNRSVKNIVKTGHNAGVAAAKSGALIGGGISAIQNVVAVIKGEKDAGEAVIDTAKDTAGAAVLSYGTGALGSTISHTLSYSTNTMLKSLSKTNLPSQIAVAALETGKTMKKYICGEINGTQCMTELGEKGTGMIASSYGAVAGQVLIPIPVVGGMIGSMVGYAFASTYYNGLVTLMQDRKMAREERIRIEAECKETLEAIRAYRREAERIAEEYFADHKRVFDNAFSTISQALQTGDADGVISGANMITEKLGGQVQYRNMDEFDDFMNNEDLDFVL